MRDRLYTKSVSFLGYVNIWGGSRCFVGAGADPDELRQLLVSAPGPGALCPAWALVTNKNPVAASQIQGQPPTCSGCFVRISPPVFWSL